MPETQMRCFQRLLLKLLFEVINSIFATKNEQIKNYLLFIYPPRHTNINNLVSNNHTKLMPFAEYKTSSKEEVP